MIKSLNKIKLIFIACLVSFIAVGCNKQSDTADMYVKQVFDIVTGNNKNDVNIDKSELETLVDDAYYFETVYFEYVYDVELSNSQRQELIGYYKTMFDNVKYETKTEKIKDNIHTVSIRLHSIDFLGNVPVQTISNLQEEKDVDGLLQLVEASLDDLAYTESWTTEIEITSTNDEFSISLADIEDLLLQFIVY